MNIAITMILPTASKAATAAIEATITSPRPSGAVATPTVRAKPSSKVEILSGRQNTAMNPATKSSVSAIRGNSTGTVASACASQSDDHPKASSQMRLSRLP